MNLRDHFLMFHTEWVIHGLVGGMAIFEWENIVSDCCLMPTLKFFSYNLVRTSQFSMRW